MYHLFTPIGISIFINVLHWARAQEEINLSEINKAYKNCLSNTASSTQLQLLNDLVLKCFHKDEKILVKNSESTIYIHQNNTRLSAEIQSIHQLLIHKNWSGTTFYLHLLTTDSQASILAAPLIKRYFNNHPLIKQIYINTIAGLQINHSDQFKDQGIQALINYIYQTKNKSVIINNKPTKLKGLLNITSGYKGITPILTIVGQLLDIPLVYLYERSDNLIEIPPLPLSFDWTRLEIYQYCFAKLSASPVKNKADETIAYSLDLLANKELQNFIYQEMIQNALIKEIDGGKLFQITYLGRLLRHHINEVYPMSTNAFGLVFELLFFELFINEPLVIDNIRFEKIIHHKIIRDREFDLEFHTSELAENQIGIGEICSYGQLADFKNNRKYHFLKQLKKQIKLFNEETVKPWCYILLIYSYEGMSQWSELNETLNDIAAKLSKAGIQRFRVYGVSLPLTVSSSNNKNPYSNIYQKKLTFDKQKWRVGHMEQYGNPWLWIHEINFNNKLDK